LARAREPAISRHRDLVDDISRFHAMPELKAQGRGVEAVAASSG